MQHSFVAPADNHEHNLGTWNAECDKLPIGLNMLLKKSTHAAVGWNVCGSLVHGKHSYQAEASGCKIPTATAHKTPMHRLKRFMYSSADILFVQM